MSIVIIPAAGLASRLRPISNMTTKSMIPILGKPAISYILNEIKEWATDIRIVYGKSDDIVEYCQKAYSDLPITFYKQGNPLGPLHAVNTALKEDESNLPLTIWLGDTIVLDYTPNFNNEVVYGCVDDWERWCLIDSKGMLHDKPNYHPNTDRALVGIYTFDNISDVSNRVNKIIHSNVKLKEEFQISQLLETYDCINQIKTNEWYDCGDFPSLYQSRARLLNRLSRDDNELTVDTISGTIKKSGSRCISEIKWYQNIPKHVKPFVPTIYNTETLSYVMEFCPGTSLQDIFVYENLKEDTVKYTINKVLNSYEHCFLNGPMIADESSKYMWIDKNLKRFESYNYPFINKEDLQLIKDVVKSETYSNLIKQNSVVNCIHGDLHFGNILFDYNIGKVKFIDPRGNWCNTDTIKGDIEYDISKLYQSVYCEYMWIINNVKVNQNLKDFLLKELDMRYDGDKYRLLSAIMMSSCLPFHNENPYRQMKIWNTSIKLIKEINEKYCIC